MLQEKPAKYLTLNETLIKACLATLLLQLLSAVSWSLLIAVSPLTLYLLGKLFCQLRLLYLLKQSIEEAITQFTVYHRTCSRAINRVQELQLLAKYNDTAFRNLQQIRELAKNSMD